MSLIGKKEGLWLLDKPVGISSFGLVARVRRLSGVRKVGHAGTLDPLASGLMIVLVGKEWTKQADKFIKKDKTYQVEMRLGEVSSTGDAEGVVSRYSELQPGEKKLREVIAGFVGEIEQTPPAYSAIKVDGVRAYKLARQGKKPILKSRKVQIYSIENVHYSYPVVSFTAEVSSGTYIRSLVEDVGKTLGTGAYMSALRRTAIGEYSVDQAGKLD